MFRGVICRILNISIVALISKLRSRCLAKSLNPRRRSYEVYSSEVVRARTRHFDSRDSGTCACGTRARARQVPSRNLGLSGRGLALLEGIPC